MITTRDDTVVYEVTTTLREWHKIWISLYLDNQADLFERVGSILSILIDARTELINLFKQNTATTQDATSREQQIAKLKTDIVNKLDLGNRLLNLDLVPRDEKFNLIDPVELSPIKLYKLHSGAIHSSTNSYEVYNNKSNGSYACRESIISNTGSTLSSLSHTSSESTTNNHANQTSYHLQLALNRCSLPALPPDELVEVYLSIMDASVSNIVQVTEKFLLKIKNDELFTGPANTIFTNLGPIQNRDICLHAQVYRVGKMILTDSYKTAFGRQQSSHNFQSQIQDGSTSTLSSTSKCNVNGLSRSRHSTIGYNNSTNNYRRPFGAAIVPLKEYSKSSSFNDTIINVKVLASNESEFSQLNELHFKRTQSSKSNPSQPNVQFDFCIKFISGPQDALANLTTLSQYCLTEKRGFPDIVMPGDFKNDLYFTLESAEFEKGGKSISKNIEASISLIDKAGLVIDNCISPASNCDNISCHKSCVFYHSNSPKWNESIKINVPLIEFDNAHIRIEFRHCSTKERDKKFLGFSFLPLSDEDGTVIGDKSHELYLYKCDSQLWDGESLNLSKYTSLPYGPSISQKSCSKSTSQSNFSHSSREVVVVNTFLLSTKLTQNSNLLNLLKWRELIKRNNKDFEEALKKVLVLKGEEIVKFLQDILDTLFDTFTLYSTSEDDYSALIFKVLVHIFLLLDEPKYQHFRPVLDTYASAHFSATLVYKGLLACVKKCLEYSSIVERHVPIQKCFKSIKYVFQFIVQSKILYSKATGEQNDELFMKDLRQLLTMFESMLISSNPKLIPIQVTFLESFPSALEQLVKVMSPIELADVVISLAGSAGFQLTPPLSKAKLLFMKKTASSELIKNQDVRLKITENFCKHLECYIKYSEELELSCDVLDILIVKIHDYHWPAIYRLYQLTKKGRPKEVTSCSCSIMTVGEVNTLARLSQIQANQLDLAILSVSKELQPFMNLMDPLLILLDQLVKDFNNDKLVVQHYCTCLLTILKLMGKYSFEHFLKKRKIDNQRLCNLFRSFRAVYNRDWSVMQLTSHAILEYPIGEFSKDMIAKSDPQIFNRQISSYVNLIVDFITHPTLQLESFSERKRNYILNIFGDLRMKFSAQLITTWSQLTSANICDLIPTSIQAFLDAALLPNEELQHKIIPVFWDMINAEDQHKTNSRQIERCLIDNIDLFINLDRGDISFIENFDNVLRQLIMSRSPVWQERGLKLINSITKLMKLLIEYRKSMESYENRWKQMSCLVDLLNYFKDQERTDLHLKYLFKLCDMHLEVDNYVEAALTLKLYTDEIKWCQRNLNALDGYRPEEQEWVRKEALYQRIIHYFDVGKCWEETISLCKELASFYENFLVDYEKVSNTLKKLAQILDNILLEHRPEREYFRVEFLGSELPNYVRGKEFIYRGGEYERLSAFMQRMTSEFPGAQVLSSKSKKSISIDSPGQYMVISNVKPVPSLQEHLKSGQRNINDKIIHYYLNNRLDTFSYDVPILKGKEKLSESNVKNLWVGRYNLKLKKQLPDILPWSEVVSQDYTEISPISHAIETISGMNVELIKLIQSYRNEPSKQISPLTMRLQGVIEAAVNGGPAVFVNAFLRQKPSDIEDQIDLDLLIRLRELIKQQFSILEAGLTLHSKLAPPEVMPLHARLVERLQNMRQTLEETNQVIENKYELVNHIGVNKNLTPDTIKLKLNTQDNGVAKDEVDHPDLNGNIYGEIEDQIYSQPTEPPITRQVIVSNGTKSEFSSPSRHNYTCSSSSSLSTLAVLNNMPVNRSRISLTPSKEVTLNLNSNANHININDINSKAARKLTFDGQKATNDGVKIIDNSGPFPSSYENSLNQEAPPLPPRSFLNEKHHIPSRAANRSPYLQGRNISPSDGSLKRTLKDDISLTSHAVNLGSLSSIEASRVLQSIDQEPAPVRPHLPSNLPRLLKSSPNPYTQQQIESDPPPLPQRTRSSDPDNVLSSKITMDKSSPDLDGFCGEVENNLSDSQEDPTSKVLSTMD